MVEQVLLLIAHLYLYQVQLLYLIQQIMVVEVVALKTLQLQQL
jgi:hypothetical protein